MNELARETLEANNELLKVLVGHIGGLSLNQIETMLTLIELNNNVISNLK